MNTPVEGTAEGRRGFDPPAGAPVRSGRDHPNPFSRANWWQRNRLALVVVALLVPVTGAMVVGNSWRKVRLHAPTEAVEVGAGQSTAYGGSTMGPVSATFTDAPGPAPGSRVLHVTLPVATDGLAECSVLLREATGGQREWTDGSDLLTGADPFSTTPRECSSIQPVPYVIENDFVIPTDADGPFTIVVQSGRLLPTYVEFSVVPTGQS